MNLDELPEDADWLKPQLSPAKRARLEQVFQTLLDLGTLSAEEIGSRVVDILVLEGWTDGDFLAMARTLDQEEAFEN